VAIRGKRLFALRPQLWPDHGCRLYHRPLGSGLRLVHPGLGQPGPGAQRPLPSKLQRHTGDMRGLPDLFWSLLLMERLMSKLSCARDIYGIYV